MSTRTIPQRVVFICDHCGRDSDTSPAAFPRPVCKDDNPPPVLVRLLRSDRPALDFCVDCGESMEAFAGVVDALRAPGTVTDQQAELRRLLALARELPDLAAVVESDWGGRPCTPSPHVRPVWEVRTYSAESDTDAEIRGPDGWDVSVHIDGDGDWSPAEIEANVDRICEALNRGWEPAPEVIP